MGRIAADQRTTNGVTKTTTYATPSVPYNYDGSIAQLTYPSGRTITYTPSGAGRSLSAADTANNISYAMMAMYTPQGALRSLTSGGSILSSFYYNNRLQPCRSAVNATGTAPSTCSDGANKGDVMDFTYDFHLGASDNGNVYKISNNRTNASDRNINYTYDSLNRIWQAYTDGNLWGETYSIDTWGNLSAIGSYSGKPAGETLSQGIDTANRFMNACSANCYDTAGNLLNDGLNSYTYDAEGHTSIGAGVTYYYDGDGKRVRKSSGTLYWYGSGSDALDETDASGNLTNEYIFFGGKRIARGDSSNNVFYYFTDNLGTSRAIVQSGQTTPCYDQDFYPFGREVPHGSETPAFVNSCPQNYKFTGKERDSESGLDNFGARYDSSQYGRFMTPDPGNAGADRMNPQSWNMYSYAENNPIIFTDPTGMSADTAFSYDDWLFNSPTCGCNFNSQYEKGGANVIESFANEANNAAGDFSAREQYGLTIMSKNAIGVAAARYHYDASAFIASLLAAGAANEIDPNILVGLGFRESRLNPSDKHGGLFQIQYPKDYGIAPGDIGKFEVQIPSAAKALSGNIRAFHGNVDLGIASWTLGVSGTQHLFSSGGMQAVRNAWLDRTHHDYGQVGPQYIDLIKQFEQ